MGCRRRRTSLCAHASVAAALIPLLRFVASAQELDPRRWSHLPEDVNFAGAGYASTRADIFVDPVFEIEDVQADVQTVAAKYIRTAGLLGRSVRGEVTVPYQDARWDGLLQGEPATVERNGFADPFVRLAVNVFGGPALEKEAFARYRAENPVETIVGAGLSVQLPLGEYYNEKLLNLGENRYTIRPELGVLHTRRQWAYELTGFVGTFTDNNDFRNGNVRAQDPLYVLHGHIVYTFRPGLWVGGSGAYGRGGESRVNGVARNDGRSDLAGSVSLGFPVNRSVGLKAAYLISRTQRAVGLDSDTIVTALSVMW